MGRVGAWLGRLFQAVPSDQLGGIQLQGPSWEVAGRHVDQAQFFRALERLVPEESILLLEGGVHPPPLRALLETYAVPAEAKVALGTAWPHTTVFHLPATPTVLRGLAEVAETCASPEICDHLHVYRTEGVLLQWHDAFLDPFYVSKRLHRDAVEAFCRELKTSLKDSGPAGA